MNKLQLYTDKVLKLTNVLEYKILNIDENLNLNVIIEQMQSYIKTKGAIQVGPIIQYTNTFFNDVGELDIEIVIMFQCDKFIHNIEAPYFMEDIIRVTDSMYCRYMGPENKLKFAYDKINLEAFENDIILDDCNYTIFVSNNVDNDIMIADVFIPIVKVL